MNKVSIDIAEIRTELVDYRYEREIDVALTMNGPATARLSLDPGLIVDWHAREGGGVWATVRLPLLQTMEEMVALVGVRDDDTMPEEE